MNLISRELSPSCTMDTRLAASAIYLNSVEWARADSAMNK